MRVTDAETMEVVEWVLAGEVQQDIVGLINQAGGKAVGLTGRDGGLIRAQKLKLADRNDPSAARTTSARSATSSPSTRAWSRRCRTTPSSPSSAPSASARRTRATTSTPTSVAGKLATVLKAEKLMLLTNTPGVLDKDGNLLTNLSAREIDDLFADGTISGGMLPKIEGALDAAKSGVNAVHIIDGRVPHAMLLEILTDQAYGTMIRAR